MMMLSKPTRSERATHGTALENLGAVPTRAIDRLADDIEMGIRQINAMIAAMKLIDAAMDDIHGAGASECDSNGAA
jgi:hypothetical protein